VEPADRAHRLLGRPRRRVPDARPDLHRFGWWALKQIWNKGLIYEGHKVVPYCPRCGTALASHEVAQGYQDVTDTSVYVRLQVRAEHGPLAAGDELLIWTTLPWTVLPTRWWPSTPS
jgi:isoleucyl-tRNA synthetase